MKYMITSFSWWNFFFMTCCIILKNNVFSIKSIWPVAVEPWYLEKSRQTRDFRETCQPGSMQ